MNVVGTQFHRAPQLRVGAAVSLQGKISASQLIVRVCVTRVDLHGVSILNAGFAKLVLIEVAVATLQVFPLTYVGITRASEERSSDDKEQQNKRDASSIFHTVSTCAGGQHTSSKD